MSTSDDAGAVRPRVAAGAGGATPRWFLGWLVPFTAICVAAQTRIAAYTGDLSRTPDEAAHFVNSAMIRDYWVRALGTDPVRFALEYYAHLPRVSVGHWPPFFHAVQAGVFVPTGPTFAAALGLQALAGGASAALTAALVGPRAGGGVRGAAVGAVAGLAVLASPSVFGHLGSVMLDVFLSVLVLLALLAWAAYARTGRTAWSVAFALCAAAAILTKGNAFGLGLLPVLYVALSGRFALAANWRTWLSAAVVLALTAPWYALTYKISSDGFIYAWGLDYTARAVPAYARAALGSLGPVALLGFALGTIAAARRARRGQRDEVVLACASAALGLYLFQLVAPADIQARYLIAIVPPVMVVAALGFVEAAHALHPGRVARPAWPAAAAVAGLLANAALTFRAPDASPRPMNEAARVVLAAPDPAPLVLVAAGSSGEGALIAAFAAFDPARTHYVVRADKALAASNFMGSNYRARFADAREVERWIADHRIGWLVLDDAPDSMEALHDRQVAALARAGRPGWLLASEHRHPAGTVRVFRLQGAPATPAEVAAVLKQVAPDKVIGGRTG